MSGFGDFWTNLVKVIPTLPPGSLSQVGGFFNKGSNTKVMQLLQQLHDDPTSAASVKTALIQADAPDTVLNWVDAAGAAAAAKDANGFNNAIAQARDAELHSNGTFGSIGNVLGGANRGGGFHPHFGRR